MISPQSALLQAGGLNQVVNASELVTALPYLEGMFTLLPWHGGVYLNGSKEALGLQRQIKHEIQEGLRFWLFLKL